MGLILAGLLFVVGYLFVSLLNIDVSKTCICCYVHFFWFLASRGLVAAFVFSEVRD